MINASSPQWISDIRGDEKKYYNKRFYNVIALSLIYLCVIFIVSILDSEVNNYASILLLVIIILLFLFISYDQTTLNLPNLLAANLYSIGSELEFFDLNSPTYIKRNQKYLRNCRNAIKKLDYSIKKEYFLKDYVVFIEQLDDVVQRLNYFYSDDSNLKEFSNISDKIKELANKIHQNHDELTTEHAKIVKEILSELRDIEPLPLKTSITRKLAKSLNESWYNLPYSIRVSTILIIIGIIIFSISAYIMISILDVNKSEGYGYAIVGTMTLIAGLITKIDQIIQKKQ